MIDTVSPSPEARDFFDDVVYVVEATTMETSFLYREHAMNRANLSWDSQSVGKCIQIGTVAGRPIMLCVYKARVLGHPVAFWEMTSALQDYTMAERYLHDVSRAFDRGHRTNASNFWHCLHHLATLNREDFAECYPLIWDYLRKRIVTPPQDGVASNDLVRLAMERAVKSVESEDGTFDAGSFGAALHRLAFSGRAEERSGRVDEALVRVILFGRSDVQPLVGGAYRFLLANEEEQSE